MKLYVAMTGVLFGLLTLVHVWRMTEETQLASEPAYLGITALSAALAVWAWRLLRRSRRTS